jgi:hypothetical protein
MSVVEDFIKKLKNLNERRNLAARKKLAVSHLVERHCVKPLTAEQKKDICDFWERISGTKKKYFDFLWYEVYNGVCQDPAKLKYYIPNDFYYCYVDYFFANDHYGRRFDDKTLYQLYFPEIKHPETIVRKSGEDMLDSQYQIISIDKAMQLCHEAGTVIYKNAREASGGKSIRFWSVGDDELFLRSMLSSGNYVIQKLIRQHQMLNYIHAASVNTIRLLTLQFKSQVHVVSAILRMGSNGKKVDNGSSGGMFCGILPDGQLRPTATDFSGRSYTHHPQGACFAEVKIPNYQKICSLVKQMAPRLENVTRLISWDIAVGEDGEPILVEPNLYYGGCNVHQLCNGPIFGDMTEEVLRYLFKHNPMLR